MERVTDIGGLFSAARDAAALARWSSRPLRSNTNTIELRRAGLAARGEPTALSPFPEATDYFGDSKQMWMVNFRVRDLDAVAAQLRAAGIGVEGDQQHYRNGRFARLRDSEGNPAELWQPAGRHALH